MGSLSGDSLFRRENIQTNNASSALGDDEPRVYRLAVAIHFAHCGNHACFRNHLFVSPMRFVNGYRALIFRDEVTKTKWWESAVCSNSARVCDAMIACFAVFILYTLWIGEFR